VSRVAQIFVVLLALALPAVAQASAGDVIRDCAQDGDLDHHYSNSELRQAKQSLPSDLSEYSDCRDVIAGALTSGSDKGRGRNNTPKGGAGATAKVAEQTARKADAAALASLSRHKPKLQVGGETVEPGSNGLFNLSSASNGLPLPLLLSLIAVGLLAVVGGLYALRRRIPWLARLPLPSIDLSRVTIPRRR
jgi:hypothetical protein